MACSDYFQPYIAWLQQGSPNEVGVVGVANRPNQGCYYLSGRFYSYNGTQLFGDGTQYFNDRAPGNNPFNPTATDRVGLTLTLPNGPLVMTLESWGNVLMQYTLECKDNLLFGYSGDIAIIISLSQFQAIV
jgi:hypothetical protein